MAKPVWFWQTMISPHMAGLAAALAARGREVTYVASQPMSVERAALGWQVPDLGRAKLCLAADRAAVEALVADASAESVHICQGLRGNGLVRHAQRALAGRGLAQWVVMETVEERGCLSALAKRLEYSRLIRVWRHRIAGILATGYRTPTWLMRCGMPSERVFPFAYFLPDRPIPALAAVPSPEGRFRLLFVGRLDENKGLRQLIETLSLIGDDEDFELRIVGAGPLETELYALARARLPGHFEWLGRLRQDEVGAVMAEADCLVLPSRHDGWGAVISEALMVGTPVICSDGCGAAGVVARSGRGGVFCTGDVDGFARMLLDEITAGRVTMTERVALARWAQCLGAQAGADYLNEILEHPICGVRPPWEDVLLDQDRDGAKSLVGRLSARRAGALRGMY